MKKFFTMMVLVTVLAFTLCGCDFSDSDQQPQDIVTHVAIVAADHANAPKLAVHNPDIQNALYECSFNYGQVCFIRADGSPQVVYSAQIPAPKVNVNKAKKEDLAQGYSSELQAILASGQLNAVTPEVDVLEAIRQGSYQLNNAPEGRRLLVLCSSGLATAGYVNFQKSLLNSDPEAVVAAVEKAQATPDLQGIDVVWLGLGEVANPQPPLSMAQVTQMEAIWEGILMQAGASSVTFKYGVSTGIPNDPDTLPHVSVVPTEERTLDGLLPTTIFTEDDIAFIGNTAEFRDGSAAAAACQKMAATLKATPQKTVLVYGQTAGGPNGTEALALARANAVADLLMSLGVSERQLQVAGHGGANSPYYIPDLDDNSLQIEAVASQNRVVRIMDIEGSDAALALQ